jgi:hypothetical protein
MGSVWTGNIMTHTGFCVIPVEDKWMRQCTHLLDLLRKLGRLVEVARHTNLRYCE